MAQQFKGVAPFDPESDVGKFRVAVGDTHWTELDPPEEGYGNYEMYSDDEINAFLSLSGSVAGAISDALFQMALAAASSASSIQDYDLRIDTTKRATELRLLAQGWRDRANQEDADIFEIVDTPLLKPHSTHIEGMPFYGSSIWR